MRRMIRAHCWVLLAVAMVLAGAACGQSSSAATPAPPSVLPAKAVSYLPSSTRTLTADELLKETSGAGMADSLSRWGFLVGAERVFQGRSNVLKVVESRTLLFSKPSGATAYVKFVHDHPTQVFGAPPMQAALVSKGRHGWAITLAACACHMATPALVGVTSSGRRVTWLEVNGPKASAASLAALMAKAP